MWAMSDSGMPMPLSSTVKSARSGPLPGRAWASTFHSAPGRELHRVAHQVEEDLAQAGLVAHQPGGQARMQDEGQFQALVLGGQGKGLQHRVLQVRQRELGGLDHEPPGLDAGEVQDVRQAGG